MKFLLPVALVTLAAFASANTEPNCDAEAAAFPTCAQSCVVDQAKKHCESGENECICATETLDTILEDAADCVSEACKDFDEPIFPPIRDYCECLVPGSNPPPTTSLPPGPQPTCADEQAKIPNCATNCVNTEAAKFCTPGHLECSCEPEMLERIIDGAADCVAAACEGAGPVFPPLRDFCACELGDSTPPTTISSSAAPPETTSTSASPTTTETSEPAPTTSSEPVTPAPPTETTCKAGNPTKTVTVTTTTCAR